MTYFHLAALLLCASLTLFLKVETAGIGSYFAAGIEFNAQGNDAVTKVVHDVHKLGRVLVLGFTQGGLCDAKESGNGNYFAFIASYSITGKLQWMDKIISDQLKSVATDPVTGEIFSTGATLRRSPAGLQFSRLLLMKHTADGTRIIQRAFGEGAEDYTGQSVKLHDKWIYAVGSSTQTISNAIGTVESIKRCFCIKVDRVDFILAWENTFKISSEKDCTLNDVVLIPSTSESLNAPQDSDTTRVLIAGAGGGLGFLVQLDPRSGKKTWVSSSRPLPGSPLYQCESLTTLEYVDTSFTSKGSNQSLKASSWILLAGTKSSNNADAFIGAFKLSSGLTGTSFLLPPIEETNGWAETLSKNKDGRISSLQVVIADMTTEVPNWFSSAECHSELHDDQFPVLFAVGTSQNGPELWSHAITPSGHTRCDIKFEGKFSVSNKMYGQDLAVIWPQSGSRPMFLVAGSVQTSREKLNGFVRPIEFCIPYGGSASNCGTDQNEYLSDFGSRTTISLKLLKEKGKDTVAGRHHGPLVLYTGASHAATLQIALSHDGPKSGPGLVCGSVNVRLRFESNALPGIHFKTAPSTIFREDGLNLNHQDSNITMSLHMLDHDFENRRRERRQLKSHSSVHMSELKMPSDNNRNLDEVKAIETSMLADQDSYVAFQEWPLKIFIESVEPGFVYQADSQQSNVTILLRAFPPKPAPPTTAEIWGMSELYFRILVFVLAAIGFLLFIKCTRVCIRTYHIEKERNLEEAKRMASAEQPGSNHIRTAVASSMEAKYFGKRQAWRQKHRHGRRRSSVTSFIRTFAGEAVKEAQPPKAIAGAVHGARRKLSGVTPRPGSKIKVGASNVEGAFEDGQVHEDHNQVDINKIIQQRQLLAQRFNLCPKSTELKISNLTQKHMPAFANIGSTSDSDDDAERISALHHMVEDARKMVEGLTNRNGTRLQQCDRQEMLQSLLLELCAVVDKMSNQRGLSVGQGEDNTYDGDAIDVRPRRRSSSFALVQSMGVDMPVLSAKMSDERIPVGTS